MENEKKKKTNGFANFVEVVGVIVCIISVIVIISSIVGGDSAMDTVFPIGIGAFVGGLLIITISEILNVLIDIFNKLP